MLRQKLILKLVSRVTAFIFLVVVSGNGLSYAALLSGPTTRDACMPSTPHDYTPDFDNGMFYSLKTELSAYRSGEVWRCPVRYELKHFSSPMNGFAKLLEAIAVQTVSFFVALMLLVQLLNAKTLNALSLWSEKLFARLSRVGWNHGALDSTP